MNRDVKGSNDRIFSACVLDAALLDNQLSDLIVEKDILHWDEQTDRFTAEHIRIIGKLVIHRQRIERIPVDARHNALIELIKKTWHQLATLESLNPTMAISRYVIEQAGARTVARCLGHIFAGDYRNLASSLPGFHQQAQ